MSKFAFYSALSSRNLQMHSETRQSQIAYFVCAVLSHPPFPANNALSMGKKTPFRRQAMRPIVNMPEDRATDTGNRYKKFGKDRACGTGDIPADRQTDILMTILRNCFRGRSNRQRMASSLPSASVSKQKSSLWSQSREFNVILYSAPHCKPGTIPYVRLSVCHTPGLCQNDCT